MFNNRLQSPISILKMISTINTQPKSNADENINIKPDSTTDSATNIVNDKTTVNWDYSLSDIHSKLISDLFKKLGLTDKISSKSTSFARANSTDKGNISPSDNTAHNNLIGSSPRRQLKRYLTSVGFSGNFQKTTSNNSLPKNRFLPNDCAENALAYNVEARKKTGLFKKSYSQMTKVPFRNFDLSRSLKNIPKDNTSYNYFANHRKLNSIQGSVVNLNQGEFSYYRKYMIQFQLKNV